MLYLAFAMALLCPLCVYGLSPVGDKPI